MNYFVYFWLFLKASLFSTGGFGNLPSLHADLIPRHWATEQQFAEAMLVGQISPGPNGLWVICLGYLTGGLLGALLALIAITLPPLLVLLVNRAYHRVREHPAVQGFVRGLSLAVLGIFATVLAHLLTSSGASGIGLFVMVVAVLLALSRRVPVVLIIGLAACVGLAVH